jgi:diacylglycerol O-acyltransferase / wax synthase
MNHSAGDTDNTLAYMDQGSYLALRALGRGPLIQYTWIYERGVDMDGLRRFHRNLANGLLGRLVERSTIPGGRHHWVSSGEPGSIDISAAERRRDDVWDFVNERANVPVDPEHGPPWHIGVQPLVEGGAVISLVVSHTVADAAALIESITHAVNGTGRDLDYPAAGARTREQALRADVRTTLKALREVPAAVIGAARIAREQADDLSESAKAVPVSRVRRPQEAVNIPTIAVRIDQAEWDARAKALGGSSNALLAGIAARIGAITGRVDADGRAMLSLPVSERVADDTRGNALNTITVMADPQIAASDLGEIRRDIKAALIELAETRELQLAPLPLAPYTPKFLLRRLEKMVLKIGKPIGSSNSGNLPEEVNRPDGTPADLFFAGGPEPGITAGDLERMGGRMMVAAGNVGGAVCVSVAHWEPGAPNTKDALMQSVKEAFYDFDLTVVME